MNPKVAEALNQVALPVVPYDTCKQMDYWWFQVKPSMICCGYTLPDELKSVCQVETTNTRRMAEVFPHCDISWILPTQGDSGGPLVCQDHPDSPWELHGITSFGPIGCIMNKKPSVFTRSSAYLPWISNVIRRDIYEQHSRLHPRASCLEKRAEVYTFFLTLQAVCWTFEPTPLPFCAIFQFLLLFIFRKTSMIYLYCFHQIVSFASFVATFGQIEHHEKLFLIPFYILLELTKVPSVTFVSFHSHFNLFYYFLNIST